MAEHRGFWGIDIGQAGLKAMRLRYAEAAGQAIAVAFDYVPHPKILSQPDALPEELIPQALEKFLSRNEVKGDAVAISVPSQTSLARFIQLPPVESSKVAEIVKYEARQQIPFALEDVIWDFQTVSGGIEESGYMLEAEVGLFAMKKEQVQQHLKPFLDAKVEVDLIQTAPLALYNFLSYDMLGIRPDQDVTGADEYTVLLDMGADNTILLVSNGEKIWIRNVPVGGNHFTRALTKEMKLTFAKAEHLKCNATKSPDPRAVFQALRPVFNDYVSEIQRSIGYFSSVNRDASIGKIIGLGNGFKLAGLQKFLQQNLQYPVERVDSFQAVVGDKVVKAPLFRENQLSFAVPYGLALQVMEQTRIRTTLLPPEIKTARTIRRKKPWAVATAASLLLGLSLSAVGYGFVARPLTSDDWDEAVQTADGVQSMASNNESAYQSEVSQYNSYQEQGEQLFKPLKNREYWLELYAGINACLPVDPPDRAEKIEDITKRNRIKLTSITAKWASDLSVWFQELQPPMKNRMLPEDVENPPQGSGYVVTLRGVHNHRDEDNPDTGVGTLYVQHTLLKNLKQWTVQPPNSSKVPVRKIGITHPTITWSRSGTRTLYENQKGGQFAGARGFGGPSGAYAPGEYMSGGAGDYMSGSGGLTPGARPPVTGPDGEGEAERRDIPETRFIVQFVWKPTPPAERPEQKPDASQAAGGGGAGAGETSGGAAAGGAPPSGGGGASSPAGGSTQ